MKNSFYFNTGIIGLIGHPVKHSYSPFIHNVAIELKKLDYIYLPFDVPSANLKNALKGVMALGLKGFNVTIPHKVNLLQLVHNVSEEASIIGAVNTVVNDLGKLTGYNTDVNGILETLIPFKEQIANREVTLVGAGGAARAIIYVLVRHFRPEKINLVNRTEERAEGLRVYFKDKMKYDNFETFELFPPQVQKVFERSTLIINATPVGMFPEMDDAIININSAFHKDQIVFDLVYNPPRTKLLQMAESKGAVCLDGLKMLVYQAAKSFKLWTNEDMPVEEVYKSLQLMILD